MSSGTMIYPLSNGSQPQSCNFIDYLGWISRFDQSDFGSNVKSMEKFCPTDFRINSILSTDQSFPFNKDTEDEPTPTAPSIKRSAKKAKKRIRTIFSHKQLKTLEYYFRQQPYMVGQDRVNLAKDLSLSEAQVKVWFQNRRIKQRKCEHEKRISLLKQSSTVFDCSDASSPSE